MLPWTGSKLLKMFSVCVCVCVCVCVLKLGTGDWNEILPLCILTSGAAGSPRSLRALTHTEVCMLFHTHTHAETHARRHTHTHIHLPPQSHRAVPSQLAGRGHDTHLSQRFDQKESQRLEALLMQSGETLPLFPSLSLSE